MRAWGALVFVASTACGHAASRPPEASASCAACEELDRPREASVVAGPAPSVEPEPPTRVFRDVPADRWAVRQIGGGREVEATPRPKRTKPVDIDLVRAPFDETARLLSDAGRFNVVVEAPSASAVTVRLKSIEPYDALLILAEARGLEVSYRRGVVVVTDARGKQVD